MPDQKQKPKKAAGGSAHKHGKSKFRCAVCGHVSKAAGSCCGRSMDPVER